MNWFIKLVLLGTACSAVLAGEDISSESPTFPKMEEIESVFKRSFENTLYTESLDGVKTRSEDARSKEMPQDDLSYLEHGYHPGNADVWKLHRVWKAMQTVKRNLPQIVSSNNEPRTMAKIRNLCERHAREEFGVDFEELNCDPNQEYRSINGTCNNLKNTRWGSAPQPFERFLPADYGDDETESWSFIRNACIEGHKYKHLSGLTIEACKQMCKEDGRGCKSISYHISTSTCRFSQLGSISQHYSQPCYRPGHDFYEYIERGSTECPEDKGFFYQKSSNQCFKFFPNESNSWDNVASFCKGEGLVMAHPRDPIGLREMMVQKYGPHTEPWVNALRVGNTNNYQWQDDNSSLLSDSSLWFPGQPEEYGQGCMILLVWDWRLDTNPDQPYYARPCSGYGPPEYGYYTLCEFMDNCINNNPQCEYWAGIGECQKNPGYMLEYCKKACNVCGGSSLRRSKKDEELPNPRKISRALSDSEPREQPKVSLMSMQWGQFIDHDITLTPEREHEEEVDGSKAITCCSKGKFENSERLLEDCLPIDVTEDDYYQMDDRQCIPFIRSMPASRGCAHSPMEQINANTAFVDGSMIYGSDGSDNGIADSLRTKYRGLLKTTKHEGNDQPLPPRGSSSVYGPNRCPQAEVVDTCFLAGDVRVDEIPGLTALHTTFIRLHNIIAKELAKLNPHWTYDDEKLYQETRRIVIALVQQITYRDWLPHVVGPTLMEGHHLETGRLGYRDRYNPDVNPSIRNVFATAAFRFGHTLVAEFIKAAKPVMNLPVTGHFFNIAAIKSDARSPSSLLKGLTRCPAQPIDTIVEQAFTNSLFAQIPANDSHFYGLDLVSLNIQRGRDHGIPSYREWRKFCGLEDITEFGNLKKVMPDKLAETFKQIYHDIDDIDLFPAGLAENSIADGILGPTFSCIIARQFADTKHGDRFWYERKGQPKPFTPEQLSSIRSQGLASILCRVSEHTTFKFQPDPFLVADYYGNKEMRCSSYNFINLQPWKDNYGR